VIRTPNLEFPQVLPSMRRSWAVWLQLISFTTTPTNSIPLQSSKSTLISYLSSTRTQLGLTAQSREGILHNATAAANTIAHTGTIKHKTATMGISYRMRNTPPRARAVIYMGIAMALHFGGYEFIRNASLSLFTSKDFGFATTAAAYPTAIGLVSPFSVLLLYAYGRQLSASGPRGALFRTTLGSILWIVASSALLGLLQQLHFHSLKQFLVGITFLFQNSYQYLLYTQQWSFVGSVLTPNEGARWFATLAGCSSLVSTVTGAAVPWLLPHTGLLGLLALTATTLTGSLVLQDAAYAVAVQHGFDPSQNKDETKKKRPWRLRDAVALFSRVPTLRSLAAEVLSFQGLNTVLSVTLMSVLPRHIPNDLARSAFLGRLYALINGLSGLIQFAILPAILKRTEPSFLWRVMPLIPVLVCGVNLALASTESSLMLVATAFAGVKVLDYAVRSVVCVMVYQPLDYESRYMGKEIIGVFGSRFGKSGMSWLLSALAFFGGGGIMTNPIALAQLSLSSSLAWCSSAWWLCRLLPRQADAQSLVEERQDRQKQKFHEQQGQEDSDVKKNAPSRDG
jgi:hypothetical protein